MEASRSSIICWGMFDVEYKKIYIGRSRVDELKSLFLQAEYNFNIGQSYHDDVILKVELCYRVVNTFFFVIYIEYLNFV